MSLKQPYSLVWQRCWTDSGLARRFDVPVYDKYLSVFYFWWWCRSSWKWTGIWIKWGKAFKGILYGLYGLEPSRSPANSFVEIDRDKLLYLIDVLDNGFGFNSPEKMLLDTAYRVREQTGNLPSSIILRLGAQLIPHSSKIKSDLFCDLSEITNDSSELNHLHKRFLKDIVTLIFEINLEDI